MNFPETVAVAGVANETASPLSGHYADPNLFVWEGAYWLYATTDGIANWGSREFRAFSSTDLATWTDHGIIHTLDDSGWAKGHAWAPGHAAKDGKHYLYYTADKGSIGVAVASAPAGPFTDLGVPLVAPDVFDGTAIDPSTFTDEDGTVYLFWGNGVAHGVVLGEDMMSFDSDEVFSFQPADFREAAWVHRRNGVYFLSWSAGDTRSEDYRVLYATGPGPRGPWTHGGPVLTKAPERGILATGHHSIVQVPGSDNWVIAYHRFAIPGGSGYRREIRFDTLTHSSDTTLAPVLPSAGVLGLPLPTQ